MRLNLTRFILGGWGVFFAAWFVLALRDRSATLHQETLGSRLAYLALVGTDALLLVFDLPVFGPLLSRFLPQGAGPGWLGPLFGGAGMALALWARILLGRAWSPRVALRGDHRLVRRGPHALIRHAIYAGCLLAVMGTVLAIGEIRGLIAVGLVAAGLAVKIWVEEAALLERFGGDYRKYRAEVKRACPVSAMKEAGPSTSCQTGGV